LSIRIELFDFLVIHEIDKLGERLGVQGKERGFKKSNFFHKLEGKNKKRYLFLIFLLRKNSSVKTIISDVFILPHCILNVGG